MIDKQTSEQRTHVDNGMSGTGPQHTAMDLLSAYRRRCQELCCEPITTVTKALENAANEYEPLTIHPRITPPQLVALCEALAQDTTSSFLDLSYNDCTAGSHLQNATSAFGDVGAECVARLLKQNRSLSFVLLEGNAISGKGAQAIAASLGAGGGKVTLLNMANNPIGDLGAEAFASTLRTNKELKMLDVGNCDIGLKGILHITSALSEVPSPALETLILEGCRIMSPPQDHSTLSLAKMLSVNINLKQLYLSRIGLRDCDLEVLVGYGLTRNHTLEVLDLRANKLSGMAAMHLARLLQENKSIQVLHLANNRISDECILAIIESLPHNNTLQELDLQSCGATDAGMDILAKAIMQCKVLQKVFVWGNEFGPSACAAWRDLALHTSSQGPGEHLVTDVEPVDVDGLPSIVFVND